MSDQDIKPQTQIAGPRRVILAIAAPFLRISRWVLGLPKLLLAGAVTSFLIGLMGVIFFAGFEVGIRKFFPYSLLAKVDYRLWQAATKSDLQNEPIATGLITIDAEVTRIGNAAVPLDEKGGGLTAFGDDVLVITYSGRVYAADRADNARVTNITAPENNRAAFKKAYRALLSDPEYSAIAPNGENYLRYNDLLFFESDLWRGLLISYTNYYPDQRCVTNTMARYAIGPEIQSIDDVSIEPGDWEVIFQAQPCLPFIKKYFAVTGAMSGGRLLQVADDKVYMTSGDFGFDGARSDGVILAQDDTAQYGKVLELDILTGAARTISKGHRNSHGIAHSRDGLVFAVEHGPRGGDELNLIREGANFGWPDETLGTLYALVKPAGARALGRHDQFDRPAYAWMPSPAPSDMIRVQGFHPAWDGDLLISTLKNNSLIRLRTEGERVVYAEHVPIGRRIRSLEQSNDGKIVLWTEDHELVFLTASDLSNEAERLSAYLAAAKLDGAMSQRLGETVTACSECHSFSPGRGGAAPSLANVADDQIASANFGGYSSALKTKNGRWTKDRLQEFLSDPDGFAPGTSMPDPGIADPLLVEAVADYLVYIDDQR